MNNKKLSSRILIIVFFILFVNFLGMKFHWYSSLWWFDMPMHFLGGFWIGLVAIYFFPFKDLDIVSVLKIVSVVLFIAICWEIFEFFVDENIARNGFDVFDTSSDLFFGLSGGFYSIFYFSRRIIQEIKL